MQLEEADGNPLVVVGAGLVGVTEVVLGAVDANVG
jgi:hypothetical protein